jgi:hypothetical protein
MVDELYLHEAFLRERLANARRDPALMSTTVIERPRSTAEQPLAVPVPRPGAARTRLLLEGPISSALLWLAAPNVLVNSSLPLVWRQSSPRSCYSVDARSTR